MPLVVTQSKYETRYKLKSAFLFFYVIDAKLISTTTLDMYDEPLYATAQKVFMQFRWKESVALIFKWTFSPCGRSSKLKKNIILKMFQKRGETERQGISFYYIHFGCNKSLVFLEIWLAPIGAICSPIAPFISKSHLFLNQRGSFILINS